MQELDILEVPPNAYLVPVVQCKRICKYHREIASWSAIGHINRSPVSRIPIGAAPIP